MHINQIKNKRNNNLDIIRFFAAVLVIVSHSYPLLQGNEKNEPLAIITNGQYTIGSLAVSIFFIISGYLITMSYVKSKNIKVYFLNRILRIFPGLIFMLFITTFIVGPFISNYSIANYFTDIQTYKYFIFSSTLFLMQYNLPGVFEDNIYPKAVNGSLWTLWYEFFCYALVPIYVIFTKKRRIIIIFLLILTSILTFATNHVIPVSLHNYLLLTSYFLAGSFIFIYQDKIQFNRNYLFVSIIGFILTYLFIEPFIAILIFGTYIIFYFAFFSPYKFYNFCKFGDFSYGIYIYAFLIQQIIVNYFGNNINLILNILIVSLLSIICAFFSWHIVEKKALNFKKRL
ncbi:acyltransferase [Macrococcus capreoli]